MHLVSLHRVKLEIGLKVARAILANDFQLEERTIVLEKVHWIVLIQLDQQVADLTRQMITIAVIVSVDLDTLVISIITVLLAKHIDVCEELDSIVHGVVTVLPAVAEIGMPTCPLVWHRVQELDCTDTPAEVLVVPLMACLDDVRLVHLHVSWQILAGTFYVLAQPGMDQLALRQTSDGILEHPYRLARALEEVLVHTLGSINLLYERVGQIMRRFDCRRRDACLQVSNLLVEISPEEMLACQSELFCVQRGKLATQRCDLIVDLVLLLPSDRRIASTESTVLALLELDS